MRMLYNFWVNWSKAEDNIQLVYEDFEWKQGDKIYQLNQAPILKVETSFMDWIETTTNELPPLLTEEEKRACRFPAHIHMLVVLTDGERALALNVAENEKILYKSKLMGAILYQVTSMAKTMNTKLFHWVKQKSDMQKQVTSYTGLTRREKELKQILHNLLDAVEETSHAAFYYLVEWDASYYEGFRHASDNVAFAELKSQLTTGWSKKHENMLMLMANAYPFFKNMLTPEKRSADYK